MSDKRKLYTIVGSGFGGNLRKALVSYLYPVKIKGDIASSEIPEIISGILRDAAIVSEFEKVELSIPAIVGGELRELIIFINVTESASISIPEIVSGLFKDALFYTESTEAVNCNIPAIQSGLFKDAVFYTESTESVTAEIPSIVSGSLT